MLTVDFETTGHSFGSALDKRNRIIMVGWKEDDGIEHVYVGDIMNADAFWKAVDRHETICAYNCKFEMHWFKRCGFDIDTKHWHDPMLSEKVIIGNERKLMNLGAVCERYGFDGKDPMIDSLMKAGVCPSEMPQRRLVDRCMRDVRTTHSLHKALFSKLEARKQIHLYRNRCDFAVVLAHIEAEGMLLDAGRVAEEYAEYSREFAGVEQQLNEFTGGINLGSPDQKAHYFYGTLGLAEKRGFNNKPLRNKPSKQFPKGRPKTDKYTIQWLSTQAKTKQQKDFFELVLKRNKLKAALSKNLDFFQGVCKERSGTFHAQFNQVVAATHRLSSSGIPIEFSMFEGSKSVQFQNMPRAFKRCFKAPEGYKIVEVDAMQLEFRVAAFCGDDPQARKDIADPDFDAHIFSASKIYGENYGQLLIQYRAGEGSVKILRQNAKPHTFKPLYGGKRGTPGEEAYYAEFAARYSALAATQENWLGEVMREGELVTPWGMRFRWDTYTKPNGMVMDKHTHKPVAPQVCNYPVQNLATAEIVPIAITALYKECKVRNIDVKFVNTIHDSVVCYVRDMPGNLTAFRHCAEWAFTTAVYEHLSLFYNIEFDVPLGVEMVIGDHWNDGTETVYDDVHRRKNG